MPKSPYDLTPAEWLEKSEEEQEAARQEAGRLGQSTIERRFEEGHRYVMMCQTPDCSQLQYTNLDHIEKVGVVAKFALNQDCVPYEFFDGRISSDFVEARQHALLLALRFALAKASAGASEEDTEE